MTARGFHDVKVQDNDPWWVSKPISDLEKNLSNIQDNIIDEKTTCSEALNIMKSKSIDCLIILNEGEINSVITKKNIMNKLVNGLALPSDLAKKAALDKYIVVYSDDVMKKLQCSLDSEGIF